MKNLLSRSKIGLLYLILLVAMVIIPNNIIVYIFTALIMFLATDEYFKCIDLDKTYLKYISYIFQIISIIFMYISYNKLEKNLLYLYLSTIIILQMSIVTIINIIKEMKYNIQQIAMSILGYIYIGALPLYLLKISNLQNGNFKLGLLFVIVSSTDTFAYLIGSKFGKHKLTKISPKKTVEGSIAGIVFAVIFSILYKFVIAYYLNKQISIDYIRLIPIIVFLSAISQLGDLFASSIKRSFKKKDYGTLLKEHGGILDRIDSLIYTAPFAYFLMSLGYLI